MSEVNNNTQGTAANNNTQENTSAPAASQENKKTRMRCTIKNGKFNIGNGEIVTTDSEGIFEVSPKVAQRLSSIPGFSKT